MNNPVVTRHGTLKQENLLIDRYRNHVAPYGTDLFLPPPLGERGEPRDIVNIDTEKRKEKKKKRASVIRLRETKTLVSDRQRKRNSSLVERVYRALLHSRTIRKLRKLVKFQRRRANSRGKVNRPRSSSVTTLPPTTRDLSPLLSQTSQSTISSGNKVACASDRVIASALNKLARPEDAGRRPRRDDRPEEGTKRKTTRNGVRVSTKFDNV